MGFCFFSVSALIEIEFEKTSLLASPCISLHPFECGAVTKGGGTNRISSMMLRYLGHDITSLSLSNPLVTDTEGKQ